jgi:hypothetical protein
MRRRHRIALVGVVVATCIAGVVGLTALSTGSEGPLTGALTRVATMVGATEHAVRGRLLGSGRAKSLAWFSTDRDVARLRHPASILLGAYVTGIPATLDGLSPFEGAIGRAVPLVQLYAAWGDRPDQQFPLQLTTAIWDLGSVPLVTWEPWLVDFESGRHPNLPLRDARDRHGLGAVANGDYDFYIDAWARDAARFGHPLFVRFGHEMNDPYRYPWGPQNNSKEEYVAAWRHVVDRFRALGAGNVVWVWSPHVAYEYWDLYYPGDAYVDWVATGVLNFGPIAQWSRWWSFDEIFGKAYPKLAGFHKPVMVAEFGSLAVGGDRAAWYGAALGSLPSKYPAVRALLFFDIANDQTVTYQKVDWSLESDSATTDAVRRAISAWTR